MGAIAEDVFRSGTLGAAEDVVEFSQPGTATVMVQLIVSGTNTTVFEVNVNQGSSPTWVAMNVTNVNTGSTVASATASGIYRADVSGAREFRVRCSAYTNGSTVVTMNGSVATARTATSTAGTVVDTELPAAAALSDATANPTAPAVASHEMVWNGATWDRAKGVNTGQAQATLYSTTGTASAITASGSLGDGLAPQNAFATQGQGYLYNLPASGGTWDRQRGNVEGTALASAARTTTTASSPLTNHNAAGVRIFINVTATSATPSITIAVQEQDPISGNWIDILVSAAITTTGQKTTLIVYPGTTVTANVSAAAPLPRTWRINATHSDADSITYSVGYCLIN